MKTFFISTFTRFLSLALAGFALCSPRLAEAASPIKVYVVSGSSTTSADALIRVDADGTNQTTLANDAANFAQPEGIAIDHALGFIFVADGTGGQRILRYNLDGTGRTLIHTVTHVGLPRALALDPVNQKIYFTTSSGTSTSDRLVRINYDGTGETTLAADTAHFQNPVGLSIDTLRGHLYVSDAFGNNTSAGLLRYNLDGTGRTVMQTWTALAAGATSATINGTAVDRVTGEIYVCVGSGPSTSDRVWRMNNDGSGLTTLASDVGNFSQPASIAVDRANGFFYVGDSVSPTTPSQFLRFNLDGTGRTVIGAGFANGCLNGGIALSSSSAPTISDVVNQTIFVNGNTGALAVTVDDGGESPAASLIMLGRSSNTALVPDANIVFGGSGTARTVTVTPAAGQSGTATITLEVFDGARFTTDTFLLTVNAPTGPGAPTIGMATAGNAQASVTFTPPASDGGSAITSYTATSSPGGLTATGAGSPLTVTSLTNGTAYTFTVRATNVIGTGSPSAASNSVTPVVPNNAPTNIALSNASIAENNAANATIGTLSATDADAGQTHTFTFAAGGVDNGAFTITGNTLTIHASADFETKSSYAIRIRATDNGAGNLFFEKPFVVTISDVTISQTITFGALGGKTFGDVPFAVSATGGASGQAVTFSIFSGPATISGDTVTLTGAGSVTVRASQAGAGDYSAATPVDRTFTVAQAAQDWLSALSAGGASDDAGQAVAVDAAGNRYVTGYFQGTATFGPAVTVTSVGSDDIFVVKYDASGTALWAQSAGGLPGDIGRGIAVDGLGNVVVTGSFQGSAVFSPLVTLTSAGSSDIFVAMYNAASGALVWAQSAGGTSTDAGNGIAVDGLGNVAVTGSFRGDADFGAGGTFTSAGSTDIFVAKYDSSGNALWVQSAGGTLADVGKGIAVDAGGNVVVTGDFKGTGDFGAAGTLTSAGGDDVFLVKYDASGAALWAQSAGGLSGDFGNDVAVDGSGNVVVTGSFHGTATFGAAGTFTSAGFTDIFVAKYDASGTALWAQSAGGFELDGSTGIAVDGGGNVVVAGFFEGSATFGAAGTLTGVGFFDVFVVKYDASGTALLARSAGGTSSDIANGIAVDGLGNVVVTGDFLGSATFGAAGTLTSVGGGDIFLASLDGAATAPDIAVAQAALVADGGSVDFGLVNVGSSSAPLTFTITNPGSANLTGLAVTGGTAEFTVSALSATTVTPGGPGATFTVTFAPASAGEKTATLQIGSNVTGGKNPYDITLTGNKVNPPTDIALSANSIAENNAPGATIGTLSATDPDVVDTHTFTLASGGADNGAFTITGNTLTINGSADFEAKSSYAIRIRATDSGAGNLTFEKNFVVNVTDIIEGNPVSTELGAKGTVLPGAGVAGSGIPAGAVSVTFGFPSINDAGQCAVLATYKVGTVSTTAILAFEVANPSTMKVVVKKDDAAPSIPNSVMKIKDSILLAPDGAIAWIAEMANLTGTTGAVVGGNNTVICLDADGPGAGAAIIVARKGSVAAGAAPTATVPVGVDPLPKWGPFTSVALGRNALAFTASLLKTTSGNVGAPGPGGVTTANDPKNSSWERAGRSGGGFRGGGGG